MDNEKKFISAITQRDAIFKKVRLESYKVAVSHCQKLIAKSANDLAEVRQVLSDLEDDIEIDFYRAD